MAKYKELLLDINDRLASIWTIDLVMPNPNLTHIRAKVQECQKKIEAYVGSWRDEETPTPAPVADHPQARTVRKTRKRDLSAADGSETSESTS